MKKLKILEKMQKRNADMNSNNPVTIAFLGDSVTQGCFEIYLTPENKIETFFDSKNAYCEKLHELLLMFFPKSAVNIINAGISGGNVKVGFQRIERDVFAFNPDLVVVCFGLNDVNQGQGFLKEYAEYLENIFKACNERNIDCIYMTPNMMNNSVSPLIKDELIKNLAKSFATHQNNGDMDMFVEEGKKVAAKCNVPVCDVYGKWKSLALNGVDITALLCNQLNHPSREMHWLSAYSLIDTIFSN